MDKRKYPRFIKRLTAKFLLDNNSITGISSNISENGIFIRTSRAWAVNTLVDVLLFMPDNRISMLRGVVRHSTRTSISSMKNGMGIEIIEKDDIFNNFMRTLAEEIKNETCYPEEIKVVTCSITDQKSKAGDTELYNMERRKHKRMVIGNLNVNGKIMGNHRIEIINICPEGIFVKSDSRLDIGKKYPIKILYEGKEFFVKAEVIWSMIVEQKKDSFNNIIPIFSAGMQIKEAENKDIKELIQFIEKNCSNKKSRLAILTG